MGCKSLSVGHHSRPLSKASNTWSNIKELHLQHVTAGPAREKYAEKMILTEEKCWNVRQTVLVVDEVVGKLPFVFWGVSGCVSLHKNAISFVKGLWISFGLCWQRRAYLCEGRFHLNNRNKCLLEPLPNFNLQQTPRSEFPRKLPRKKIMGDPTFRDKGANGEVDIANHSVETLKTQRIIYTGRTPWLTFFFFFTTNKVLLQM